MQSTKEIVVIPDGEALVDLSESPSDNWRVKVGALTWSPELEVTSSLDSPRGGRVSFRWVYIAGG